MGLEIVQPWLVGRSCRIKMKYLIALLLLAQCLQAQTTRFDNAQISMFVNGSITIFVNTNQPPAPPVNFTNVALADGPNHLWMFNDASGQITDYAGSANLTIPSGLTMGQPGLLVGSSMTCATSDGTAIISLGNASVGSFNTNQPFAYEYIINRKNTNASGDFFLAAKINPATFQGYYIDLNYTSDSTTPDGSTIPASWMTIKIGVSPDGANFYNYTATCNVLSNVPSHIALNFLITNGLATPQFYFNGSRIQLAKKLDTATIVGVVTNNSIGSLANRITSGGFGFKGDIQCVAIYTNFLTEQQVMTHYLAFKGQYWQPATHLYSSYIGKDSNGNPLKINNPCIIWNSASNCYFIFGLGLTGTNLVVCSPYWDQTNVTAVTVYRSTNLTQGSFFPAGTNNAGVAINFKDSSPTLQEAVRASVVYNALNNKWVMWSRYIPVFCGSNYLAVAVADKIDGPYTVVTNSAYVNGISSPGDFTLYQEGTSCYIAYSSNDESGAVKVSLLDANYYSTSGSAVTAMTGTHEGVGMIKRGSVYFVIGSTQEYYNAMLCADVQYTTSSTPLGTYTSPTTIFTTNPLGSGLEGQGSSGVFNLQADTSRWFMTLDNWHHGDLSSSALVWNELIFPTSTTITVTPTNIITLP